MLLTGWLAEVLGSAQIHSELIPETAFYAANTICEPSQHHGRIIFSGGDQQRKDQEFRNDPEDIMNDPYCGRMNQ